MVTQSSTLAWKIPWMEEPHRYSPWGHKESDMTEGRHLSALGDLALIGLMKAIISAWNSR